MPHISLENPLIALGWNVAIFTLSMSMAKIVQVVLVKLFSSKHIFHSQLTRCIITHSKRPLLWLLVSIAIAMATPMMQLSESVLAHIQLYIRPAVVAMIGWLAIGTARGIGEWLENHYPGLKSRDALGTRRFNTQIRILMRVVITVLVVLTLVGMAMVVPALRQLGMSLFASAGVAGIVLGIAAKESFSNLIAGAQLALTQQILLGDEVVINNEFGTIEEITSSYVVVRIWDSRRLVVPLRYFMENIIENWTYHETAMFGTVYLYTDYTVSLTALRVEGERIVKQSEWWDGKRYEILVTDSKESALQLRVTVSAKNSSDVWNLRCEVREKLVNYLKLRQPWALPKARNEQREVAHWKETLAVT